MGTLRRQLPVFLSISVIFFTSVLFFNNCSKVEFQVVDSASESASPAATAPPPALPVCQKITADSVQPTLLYSWDHASGAEPDFKQVMASPAVGDIDQDGKPEVIFTSFKDEAYMGEGVLRVLNGSDLSVKKNFHISNPELRPSAATTPLIIDIDEDGKAEIIYNHHSGTKAIALNYDGTLRWQVSYNAAQTKAIKYCYQGFSAGKLQSGKRTQIIAGGFIISEDGNKQAQIVKNFTNIECSSYAASLGEQANSELSIVSVDGIYDKNGDVIKAFTSTGSESEFASTGNVRPDVPGIEVVVSGNGKLRIYSQTGDVLLDKNLTEYSQVSCPRGMGGGQSTIGDFDGNSSTLEIAVATSRSLSVFNSRGDLIAGSDTRDCSSQSTGITSFDFNGDGKPEIIYGDEQYVRIYEVDGTQHLKTIWTEINPNATTHEYPVVVDLDGSGSSKLLVVSNNMWVDSNLLGYDEAQRAQARGIAGLRVFGPKKANSWMPTRSVWNQHHYFVTNVYDNLVATASTVLNGFAGNSFKRNVQKGMFDEGCRP